MPAPPIGQASAGGPSGAVRDDQMTDPMQTAMGGDGAADPAQAQADAAAGLEALMGRIRAIDEEIQALGADMPELGAPIQQVRTALKQMVVAAAKAAPQQTPSGAAMPV